MAPQEDCWHFATLDATPVWSEIFLIRGAISAVMGLAPQMALPLGVALNPECNAPYFLIYLKAKYNYYVIGNHLLVEVRIEPVMLK